MSIIKQCTVCNKDYEVKLKGRYESSKYCSMTCMGNAQKGRANPHSKEWEEKRLLAIKDASKNRVYPKGYKRPKEHYEPMLEAVKKAREKYPDKFRERSIKNLPKDVSGEKNGNFRDWATKKSNNFRVQNGSKFKKWRNSVMEKSGNKCVLCGCGGKLDAHHIISLSESVTPAFEVWNGVALCRSCHAKTDSFGSKGVLKSIKKESEKREGLFILIKVIPHEFQEYNTVGNYKSMGDETFILVSEQGDEFYNKLIAIHELVEEALTKRRGLSESEILDFDLYFEKRREQGLVEKDAEAGFCSEAPYLAEHTFATSVEMQMCALAKVSWNDYMNNEHK